MNTISLNAAVERATGPLDWCRRVGLRWLSRSQFALSTFVDRDRRVTALACLNVALAAIAAIYFPVLLFTLGPILLGVAHVASDVRYLVLRRHLARWWQNLVWIGCLALLALRVLEELRVLRQVEHLELAVAVADPITARACGRMIRLGKLNVFRLLAQVIARTRATRRAVRPAPANPKSWFELGLG